MNRARSSALSAFAIPFTVSGSSPVQVSSTSSYINADTDLLDPANSLSKKCLSGWTSDVGISSVGSLSHTGLQPGNPHKINQDRLWVADLAGGYKFFGVADGHGMYGHLVSHMVREELGNILESTEELHRDPKAALKSAHSQLSREIFNSKIDSSFSGSTSVSVLLKDRTLFCANVGDSRAILGCVDGNARWVSVPLSLDHKPDLPTERKRILDNGGRISECKNTRGDRVGPARVWLKHQDVPGLAMSRAFGDKVSSAVGVISEPDITFTSLGSKDKTIILASDGVWEFLRNAEVLDIVSKFYERRDAEAAAKAVVDHARTLWLREEGIVDDISVIVIFLN